FLSIFVLSADIDGDLLTMTLAFNRHRCLPTGETWDGASFPFWRHFVRTSGRVLDYDGRDIGNVLGMASDGPSVERFIVRLCDSAIVHQKGDWRAGAWAQVLDDSRRHRMTKAVRLVARPEALVLWKEQPWPGRDEREFRTAMQNVRPLQTA